jgi:hypothetical protein
LHSCSLELECFLCAALAWPCRCFAPPSLVLSARGSTVPLAIEGVVGSRNGGESGLVGLASWPCCDTMATVAASPLLSLLSAVDSIACTCCAGGASLEQVVVRCWWWWWCASGEASGTGWIVWRVAFWHCCSVMVGTVGVATGGDCNSLSISRSSGQGSEAACGCVSASSGTEAEAEAVGSVMVEGGETETSNAAMCCSTTLGNGCF